ncbi:MAG TPA: bifunctional folylpolyglutamate synthase/dihydrofolate synthase [Deltaproteobacteria bacterium]|nr:bifunctional folylpolyglutamate synthase/dihydrofolate synthase [Deltaproteobacteria bacterium]
MFRLAQFLSRSRHERSRMKLGLHRMHEMLERLEHPEAAFPSVLIAGTNGKGSVARMLESVLRAAGHAVGLYTSPHLVRFNERIQINGREISDPELEAIFADWDRRGWIEADGEIPLSGGESLSWFEEATLLAFEAFRRAGVSLAVLEVGIGGRLDSTNVVEPLVSAITTIGFDHMEVLGTTLAEIAREKAGVMRRGRTTVVGRVSPEVHEVLCEMALTHGADLNSKSNHHRHLGLTLGLRGEHQKDNAAVAIEIVENLSKQGFAVSTEALRLGLQQVSHPGRLELIPGRPAILLDGAHNAPAFAAVGDFLRRLSDRPPLTFILAAMKDKDPMAALGLAKEFAEELVITTLPDNPRSLGLEAWRAWVGQEGMQAHFTSDPGEALRRARQVTRDEGWIVVTGSLFLVGKMGELLEKIKFAQSNNRLDVSII